MPSTSTGRPSSAAAPRDVALGDEPADRASTRRPSTCGTTRASKPSRSQQRRDRRRARGRSGSPRPRRRSRRRSPRGTTRANSSGASAASSGVNSTTSVVLHAELGEQLEPPLERREQLDRLPSTSRGCGWNVTTVGSGPASIAARTTARWPRCTPSNVPIATARGRALELRRGAGDLHGSTRLEREHARADLRPATRASALGRKPRERVRRGQQPLRRRASSTPNGPTAVRRSVAAVAAERLPRSRARRCRS